MTATDITPSYRKPIARAYERPAVERYIRVDVELPGGGSLDLGLEDRDGEDAAEDARRLRAVAVSEALWNSGSPCARGLGIEIERLLRQCWPDRYWFAEVLVPDGKVQRYQVIQPAVVGGFRR